MPVPAITTQIGHSLPPEGPHTITFHVPGWDVCMRFRDGDQSLLQKMTSIYPRFTPFGLAGQFARAIHKQLGLPETHVAFPFTSPDAFQMAQEHMLSEHRKENKLAPEDIIFKVADVNSVRIYVVGSPMMKMKGAIGIWQHPGIGISTRLAESLLPHVESLTEVAFGLGGDGDVSAEKVPQASYLPVVDAHQKLRERIVELLKRAPLTPESVKFSPEDVYLYGTGMAAIYRIHEAIMKITKGSVVALGSIFHNTWHLFEEVPHGFKHFGPCGANSGVMDKLEAWLQEEEKAGRKVAYVFAEFPSNPILVSVDLKRLKELADKYGFYTVIDDTIGSFCNVDLSSVADVILTSITKSFSGYADVMGGSVTLNPDSPRYQPLKASLSSLYHNEYFAGDAEKMLSNSDDYLARSVILNRNASTVAALLQKYAEDPAYPVASVQYPEQTDSLTTYQAFMRPATPEFTPGYGCLLSVEFESKAVARTFYDSVNFHQGPHLGAHLTLVVPFNELVWGKDAADLEYHSGYGAKGEQIRIAVGLESEDTLLHSIKAAIEPLRK